MADYIYLLQNRLTSAQWRALEAVREAARTHAMPLFLVGGAVRDLTSGAPVRDLDFAVQGDANLLVPDLQAAGAMVTGTHPVLGSIYLHFRGGARAELGPSLSVTYPKPGQAEAQPAPILDDLRRRDFTANAMAVSLNEGSYGLLLDPLNGTADIENRELRLVSPYGFVEQPALLLRAARLHERLGWNLEERTATKYQNAKEENYIGALQPAERGYELEEIFHEEDPLGILDAMEAEGWHDVLFPALRSGDADRGAMDNVRDLIGQLEGQGVHPQPSAVFFPLITAKLSDKDRTALKGLFLRQGFVQQIETLEARAKELGTQLTSKAAALPSDSWRLLKEAEPELVLWLALHSRTGAVQTKIKAFLKEWPQQRQKIPYALMQEMRITPDLPIYEKLLDDLFFALIDGKLDTPEATRAFLEPYSPPAPPQVTVRRRPAKSAKGRSKKAAAQAVVEDDDDLEEKTEDRDGDDADRRDADEEDQDRDDEDETGDRKPARNDTEDEDDDEDDEPEVRTPAPRAAAPKKAAAKVATEAPTPKTAPAKTAPSVATAVAPAPISKAAPQGDAAVPSKGIGTKSAAKVVSAPAEPPKKAAPVKAAAKVPAKAVVKAVPAKAAVKATAKSAPKKAAPQPVAKKSAVKVAPKKVATKAPVKVVAKKVAAKAKGALPAKRTAPVKAAKKAAVKGRSGR